MTAEKNRFDARMDFLEITPGVFQKIIEIEKYSTYWKTYKSLSPEYLGNLKKSVLVSSTGSSTRIEGSSLTDDQIEKMMLKFNMTKFSDRYQQEVAGYFEIIKHIFSAFDDDWKNLMVFGDNLQFLKTIYKNEDPLIKDKIKGKGKLIYIDPPFATTDEFQNKEGAKVYNDKKKGAEFVEFLRKRLIVAREILADDGIIYVHLDSKMSHYIKVLMDEVFGKQNFRNEIFWKKYSGVKNQASKKFTTQTDTIFLYVMNDKASFNQEYRPLSSDYITQEYKYFDKNGRRYAKLRGRGYQNNNGEAKIKYLDENPGTPITSLWDEDGLQLNTSSSERIGYPIQKPESLLERSIKEGLQKLK